MPADFSGHARTLVEQLRLADGILQLRVRGSSPLVGRGASALDFAGFGVTSTWSRRGRRPAGDVPLGRSRATSCSSAARRTRRPLAVQENLASARRKRDIEATLFNQSLRPRRGAGTAALAADRRPALPRDGDTERRSRRARGAAPGARTCRPGEPVMAGDTLLLQGTWKALDLHLTPPRGAGGELRRTWCGGRRCRWGRRAAGARRPAGDGGAARDRDGAGGGRGASRRRARSSSSASCRVEEIYRAVNWTTVILVGAMMPLSTAMSETGAARLLAEGLVGHGRRFGPLCPDRRAVRADRDPRAGDLNTATALIIIPIRWPRRGSMGVSPRPVLMAVGGGRGGVLPDADGDADEPDGASSRAATVRRLLEARPAAACSGSSSSRCCWCRWSGRSDRPTILHRGSGAEPGPEPSLRGAAPRPSAREGRWSVVRDPKRERRIDVQIQWLDPRPKLGRPAFARPRRAYIKCRQAGARDDG